MRTRSQRIEKEDEEMTTQRVVAKDVMYECHQAVGPLAPIDRLRRDEQTGRWAAGSARASHDVEQTCQRRAVERRRNADHGARGEHDLERRVIAVDPRGDDRRGRTNDQLPERGTVAFGEYTFSACTGQFEMELSGSEPAPRSGRHSPAV